MKYFGQRIYLKILIPDDVGEGYVQWMNDPDINQFLESRFQYHTLDSVKAFVAEMSAGAGNMLFGIFLRETAEHIGNIKIGNINSLHRRADIGLIIGKRELWGQGFAAEAIGLATKYAFEELNLYKLTAGMYAENQGSFKAFLKNGWQQCGTLKQHAFSHGRYVDELMVEICREA